MIYWCIKRRNALLLGMPMMALVFVLLNTAGLTQPPEQEGDSDGDGLTDAYELFFGLNPANSDDANLDYDGDALPNIEESKLLTDPFFWDTDRDGFSDLADSNAVSRAYLPWGDPQFTDGDFCEYARPDWLLGAYKAGGEWVVDTNQVWACRGMGVSGWCVSGYGGYDVSAYGSSGVASLNIDLDRSILTNNLRYAIHYSLGRATASGRAVLNSDGRAGASGSAVLDSSLYLNLLDTNGVPVAENLFGNLLAVSNAAGYAVIPAPYQSAGSTPAGIQSSNVVLLLNIPTASFPSAAVIQLRACHSRESGNPVLSVADGFPIGSGMTEAIHDADILIFEGLLYIDEDGDGLDADQEKQIGTSDYSIDSNHNGINDYDEYFNTGSLTNNTGGGGGNGGDGGDNGEDDDHGGHKKDKIIYVDQAIGNDTFTGRDSAVFANKKGPKKTVHGGLSVVETNDTIIIRSGNYNENLNISGKAVRVVIEGNVKL